MRVDEGDGMGGSVGAAARHFFFFDGVGEEATTLRVSWVGGGSPKTPRTDQQR